MSTEEHGFGSALPLESEEGISCEMSHAVDGTIKEPIMLSLLNKMNDNISSSNKLLAEFLSQHKHVMPQGHASKRNILQSDFESGNESAVSKRRRMEASATLSVNPNRLQVEPSSFPPLDVEDDNMLSPAPSIAGQDSETCPPADDALGLFGEQDLDDNNQDPNESDAIAQDAFLDKVDMATAISAPKGPPVADHLAKILNDKFHVEFEPAQRKQLIGKYLILENCTGLYRPRVNPQVWGTIRPEAKSADKSLVALQDAILTASSALAMSSNEILQSRESKTPLDYQSVISKEIDAITLLGFVSKEISYRRKEAMRPSLNPIYKAACGRTTKPTTLLFGDDMAKTMQEVKAINQITQQIAARPPRRTQFSRFANSTSQQNSFLSQRGRVYPPRRGRGTPQAFNSRGKKYTKNWKM